jgi:glycosyltransferase involved in cell wall biosynthesis/2-polyprenyl-3-methyl-5-hydroxy-6-metoxy-1,4-benzoquinol methylase
VLVCTVYDRSRLGAAQALVDALAVPHPDATVLALRVDEADDEDLRGAEVLALGDLPEGRGWRGVAASAPRQRDGVLAGALLAEALRRDGRAIFLATAIRICGPLDALTGALDEHDLALVPMAERRLPDDGRRPAADDVQAAGPVNPRIVALRRSALADELLAGWPASADDEEEAREDDDREPPPNELLAGSVEHHLARAADAAGAVLLADRGVGAAYWNLPLRPVGGDADGVTVAGDRLALLDLSGLTADDPSSLWPHQDRLKLTDVPALARIVIDASEDLRATAVAVAPPYLADPHGRPFDPVHRRLVREALDSGVLVHAPWTEDGLKEWDAFLEAPAPVGAASGIRRGDLAIWQMRADLRTVFPDLDGADGAGFARWLVEWGPGAEHPAPEQAVAPVGQLPWGVNVAGFFRSELGLGEAARLLITGLDRASVPALPVHGQFVPPTRQNAEFTYTTPSQAPYPINIVCLNGDIVPSFAREVEERFLERRHTIALWWWEVVDAFPPGWDEAFEYLDEIWVATDHIHKAIAPHSPVPVNKVRMPVTMPRISHHTRAQLGVPEDGFVFLYVFDYHSTAARKNPVGHVEAFKAAFGEGSGAKLVLKCINADRMAAQHLRTLLAIGDHPDITVIDRFVSADEKNALIAACDCYVSLHRSEGFGLTPAEAMLLGKPVIATRYGGNLDFMTDENSYLVDHGWTTVGRGAQPYPADATWAEPDLDHAARLMREVFDDPEAARLRGARAQRDIRERHDPAVAGEIMRRRLQTIHDELAQRPTDPRQSIYDTWNREDTALRIQAPLAAAGGRGGAVKSLMRRTVGRVILPYLNRQRGIDEHLLQGLDALRGEVLALPEAAAERADANLREERAQTLAALRRVRTQIDDQTRWIAAIEQRQAGTQRDLDSVHQQADQHLGEHRALPFMTEPWERFEDPDAGVVEGFRTALTAGGGEDYHDFEQRFRGTRERIMALQEPYIALLRGREPVLDCGCGRGELLELLRGAGISASGVDLDEGMLAEARRRDLDVRLGDAVEALASAAAGSIGAVTAMQVIEHLPEATLTAFLKAARHALAAGGRLVVETVNPHSVVALKAFWLDPTHQHPLFPEVVLELCREAGFDQGFVFHPGGVGDVAVDRYAIPAYAVVADVAPA